METRKGRLIPDVKPLDYFYEEGSRSPFDGEINYDSKSNIGFWVKNQNNVWESHSKTKDIQDQLDSYGETGDNTFQNATAFYESNKIHRFFYNQVGQKIWLDGSIDISKFAYYAVLSIGKDKGINRYVTGLVDSDGSDFEKALIPTSRKFGTLTKDIIQGNWYTVEFYNEKKELVHSMNYLAYQSFTMPIDLAGEDLENNGTNTITNVRLTFNQVEGGKGVAYLNHPLSELKPKLIITMADGHIVEENDVSKMNLSGFESVDTSKIGEYLVRAEYNIFNKYENEPFTVYKTYKETVLYLHTQIEKVAVRISVPKSDNTLYNRVYKEVRVRGIGNDNYVSANFSVATDNLGNDVITIPYTYFKLEKNEVLVCYTEQTDTHAVDSKPLHVQMESIVKVVEKPPFTYKKFYPIGYVETENGYNSVKYKFFILTDTNDIADITEDVTIVYPDEYNSGVANRMVAKFYGLSEVFFSYFNDVNTTNSSKRILTSLNQSELLVNPNVAERPLLLCSTLQDDELLPGIGTFESSRVCHVEDLAAFISNEPIDVIRIKAIKPKSMYISDYTDLPEISLKPSYKELRRLYNRTVTTLEQEGSKYPSQLNYLKSYRLIKYKNITVSNVPVGDEEVSDKTLKEILQTMPEPEIEHGIFIGYSLNNSSILTDEEENTVVKAGKKIHMFAFFAMYPDGFGDGDPEEAEIDTEYIPANFPGFIEITHTLDRTSIKLFKDDPLLVEGYQKMSNGNYKCLGAVVCHTSII
jgi:hypothetical protein